MSDETISLEKVQANRRARERKSQALARRFEEGVSIITAPKDEEGKRRIAKERFFEVLTYDVDGINDDTGYTPEEVEYIRKYISKVATGTGVVLALTCPGGAACPFAHRCPFYQLHKEPKGKPCPLESALFTEFLIRYIEELQVDPTNMMELAYCNELAETDILIMRANKALAKPENSEMVYIQETVTKSGEIAQQMSVSPYLEAREKLVKRRERIIKLMVGDRQERYKKASALRLKDETDESILQSKQRAMIYDAQIENERGKVEKVPEDVTTPDDLLNSIE